MGNQTLLDLGLGVNKVPVTLRTNELAITAFRDLDRFKISSIPVLNENGQVQTQIGVNDLKGLNSANFPALLLPVTEYLDIYSPQTSAPIFVLPTSTFSHLLALFWENQQQGKRIHRVWITDANQEVLGLVSLTDVINLIDRGINRGVTSQKQTVVE